MPNKIINIIQDHKKKCCATCRHAHLVSYAPYDPLLAECDLQPNPYNSHHPYIVMVANNQTCKRHDWRKDTATIEHRQKRNIV